MKRVVHLEGRTVADAARAWGVHPTTVREWVTAGRLNVVEYRLADGGSLLLITDKKRPERLVPVRRGKREA